MQKVGIVGAGNMGSGIVQKTSQQGLAVVMVDVEDALVDRGLANIGASLKEARDRGILTPEQVEEVLGRIRGTSNLSDVKDCDLVIEVIFEELEAKKKLFADLDRTCAEKTIFATNTSSFSVNELAAVTRRPDRFVGLHFFYHPAKNKLLEIIPGAQSSNQTLAAAREYAKLTGKTDILVQDAPGFAVNRFFQPFLNEAVRVLDEGIADIPTIEKAAMDCLGIGMGPFLLMNVTGIPIGYHTQNTLHQKLGDFYMPARGLITRFESGRNWNLEGEAAGHNYDAVSDRLLGSVFFTTTSLLDEGVTNIKDMDTGAKVGLRWRQGPFELMNGVGIERSHQLVEKLLCAYPRVSVPPVLTAQREKGVPWSAE